MNHSEEYDKCEQYNQHQQYTNKSSVKDILKHVNFKYFKSKNLQMYICYYHTDNHVFVTDMINGETVDMAFRGWTCEKSYFENNVVEFFKKRRFDNNFIIEFSKIIQSLNYEI